VPPHHAGTEAGAEIARVTATPWKAPAGLAFEWHDEIDSTNAELMRRARAGTLARAQWLAAGAQTAGRGRMGRTWSALPGDALLMSIAYPLADNCALAGLSLALGAAAAESFAPQAVRLKWPNDLLLADRKLGGILVESVAAHGTRWVVAGIGVNVHAAPPGAASFNAPPGVVPLQEGAPHSTVQGLGESIAQAWWAAFAQFAQAGFVPFRSRWQALHAWDRRTVTATHPNGTLHAGTAVGVDAEGALLIQLLAKGATARIDSLDYTLRLVD
jgi:BirA family transcriptional regulator, biotin operon repressor / biotin---[acetyl-CoA-carboxylase] ligase